MGTLVHAASGDASVQSVTGAARLVLALDLGTRTGWAVGDTRDGSMLDSGVWDLHPHRYQSEAMRFVALQRHLVETGLAAAIVDPGGAGLGYVTWEDVPFRARSTRAGQVWGGLSAIVMAWAEGLGLPWIGIPPAKIKHRATGKGAARKDVMISQAQARWGADVIIDDNHADALWLADLFMSDYI